MILELESKANFDVAAMVSIKKEDDHRMIKLRNTQLIELPEDKYHWLMKMCGFMVEINPKLAVNVHIIIGGVPTQNGYSLSFDIEPPAKITVDQWIKLSNQDVDKGDVFFSLLNLNEYIEKKIEQGQKCDDYKKL